MHMPILIGVEYSMCEITNTYRIDARNITIGVTSRKNRKVM